MVFQSCRHLPALQRVRVRDNIASFSGLKLKRFESKKRDPRADRTQASWNLSAWRGWSERQPSQLSGGQQQRVALARAVVMEPSVLLFDEPLSNLDAKLREQMRIDIRKLQQRLGITSIYVTHDQIEAMSISDRVVVMNRGRIEQMGSPRELYARPINRFVASFIGKAAFLPAEKNASGAWTLLGKPWRPEAGEELTAGAYEAMIRPEAVRLSPLENSGRNAIAGTVLRATYLGSVMEYEVELPGTEPVTVHIPNPFERDPLPPERRRSCAFSPRGCTFFLRKP